MTKSAVFSTLNADDYILRDSKNKHSWPCCEVICYIFIVLSKTHLDTLISCVVLGCSEVGQEEKQAQDELWEAEPWPTLLLRQEHHPQDIGETLRLPLCLWLKKPAGVHSRGAPCNVGRKARYGRVKAEKDTRSDGKSRGDAWTGAHKVVLTVLIESVNRFFGDQKCF